MASLDSCPLHENEAVDAVVEIVSRKGLTSGSYTVFGKLFGDILRYYLAGTFVSRNQVKIIIES